MPIKELTKVGEQFKSAKKKFAKIECRESFELCEP
jgi:hypothetical protein